MRTIFKLSLILLFVPMIACAQGEKETTGAIAKDVDVTEFAELIKGDGLLLDVRTPGEVSAGAIAGHTNINYSASDFSQQLDKLDKNKPVYVYCAAGGRSGKAMKMMADKGFKEVYNLKGGYGAWSAANR